MIVSPSLLAADFTRLDREIGMINDSDADWLHLDIMDGVFVPNISFGFSVLDCIAPLCRKPLDVHLMIVQPEKFIGRLAKLGVYSTNVHYEACPHLHRVVQQIHDSGMKAAVTLNPATPVCMLEDIIQDVDMVLLMTVNPGFGGQKFITSSLDKIKRLRQLIERAGSHALIQVDGGVNATTAPLLAEAGVDAMVSGSYIFGADNPNANIHYLKGLARGTDRL